MTAGGARSYTTLLELLDAFHGARVLVLGDVMLDRFIHGSVHRISPEAPIPILSVERTADMPGGAANVARNAATLGAQATLIGVVGEDAAGGDLQKQLATLPSIDVRLTIDGTRPTIVKTRLVADRQQIVRADIESRAPLSEQIESIVLRYFDAALPLADVVVLSDYGKGTLSESTIQRAILAAGRAGKPILVDPKSQSFAKYRGATILTPNRHELQVACGLECCSDEQIVAGARVILEQGICEQVVVTRGQDGMSIVGRDQSVVHLPALAREVYDVSGAGDTVLATLAVAWAVRGDIDDCARLANVAASIAVGKSGTATVTTGEIATVLQQSERTLDSSKHFAMEAVPQLIARWRERGLRIAFANGCFDLLHPGHVSLLRQARQAADRLVVGLNSDLSVRRLKGPGRPIQSEVARATILASLECVDAIVIFAEDTPLRLIELVQPDVLVKGAEYKLAEVVGAELVVARGGKVLLVDLLAGHSTTDTLKRVTAADGV